MYKKLTILFLLAIFLLNSGFGCKATIDPKTQEAMKPITLTYWRVFDDEDAFKNIIKKYQALHPYIKIDYQKLRYEEYETALLNALAEDRGPDIFSINNTWVKKYQNKIAVMPDNTSLVFPIVSGTIKQETTYQLQTKRSISLKELRDNFVDVVSHDVVLEDDKIYGLPLSLDTLAMFYNRDLLNEAGISQVPQYWNNEFLQDVKKLTKQDPKKGIIQSGVALGGSSNVQRFSDIISILMLQNGATMMRENNVAFNQIPSSSGDSKYNPGIEAVRFYTDFSNPLKESYSWNKDLPNSLDMFINGNLAIMFGYSYDLPTIKERAPKLNFSVAKLPQIEGNPPTNINFANYWVETVSKKSKHSNEAWDFIQFITKQEQARDYLQGTNHPTALRSLIDLNTNDDIKIFTDQVLTAKSWYKGLDSKSAEDAFKEMVDEVSKDVVNRIQSIIDTAAAKIQQTID